MFQTQMINQSGSIQGHPHNIYAGQTEIGKYKVAATTHFDFLDSEYLRLFSLCDVSCFQHPAWLQGLYSRLAPACDVEPLIITVHDAAGHLILLLPLVSKQILGTRVIEYADLGVTDNASPICTSETFFHLSTNDTVKQHLANAIGTFDVLRIRHLVQNGMSVGSLLPDADVEPMPFSSNSLTLDTTFDAWHQTVLDKKLRKKISKRRKSLSQQGALDTHVLQDADEITTAFYNMRRFRQPRFAESGGDLLQHDDYFSFYLDMAIQGSQDGFARTCCLSLDGQNIAVLFGLKHRGKFLYLLLGVDIENYGRYSPGFLILEDAIRISSLCGERIFDFTVGDEPFKQLYGAQPSEVNVLWATGSIRGRAARYMTENFGWFKPRVRHLLRAA